MAEESTEKELKLSGLKGMDTSNPDGEPETNPILQSSKDKITGKIIIENGEFLIYNSYGITNCLIIQMENKREMSAKELINGLKFDENSHVY